MEDDSNDLCNLLDLSELTKKFLTKNSSKKNINKKDQEQKINQSSNSSSKLPPLKKEWSDFYLKDFEVKSQNNNLNNFCPAGKFNAFDITSNNISLRNDQENLEVSNNNNNNMLDFFMTDGITFSFSNSIQKEECNKNKSMSDEKNNIEEINTNCDLMNKFITTEGEEMAKKMSINVNDSVNSMGEYMNNNSLNVGINEVLNKGSNKNDDFLSEDMKKEDKEPSEQFDKKIENVVEEKEVKKIESQEMNKKEEDKNDELKINTDKNSDQEDKQSNDLERINADACDFVNELFSKKYNDEEGEDNLKKDLEKNDSNDIKEEKIIDLDNKIEENKPLCQNNLIDENILQATKTQYENRINDLLHQLEDRDKKIVSLTNELDQFKKENDSLKEENQKLYDAIEVLKLMETVKRSSFAHNNKISSSQNKPILQASDIETNKNNQDSENISKKNYKSEALNKTLSQNANQLNINSVNSKPLTRPSTASSKKRMKIVKSSLEKNKSHLNNNSNNIIVNKSPQNKIPKNVSNVSNKNYVKYYTKKDKISSLTSEYTNSYLFKDKKSYITIYDNNTSTHKQNIKSNSNLNNYSNYIKDYSKNNKSFMQKSKNFDNSLKNSNSSFGSNNYFMSYSNGFGMQNVKKEIIDNLNDIESGMNSSKGSSFMNNDKRLINFQADVNEYKKGKINTSNINNNQILMHNNIVNEDQLFSLSNNYFYQNDKKEINTYNSGNNSSNYSKFLK